MFVGDEPYLKWDADVSEFPYPKSKIYGIRESWDNGGVAIGDTSEELTKYAWQATTDGSNIYVQREGTDNKILVHQDTDINMIDLTFDQNMRPCICYTANHIVKLFWYDAEAEKQVVTTYPNDYRYPKVSLDDKRRFNISNSDIIFMYQKGDSLYFRLQRDRYLIERLLLEDTKHRMLWRIGMGKSYRFLVQWR